jgi:hypothetical protein
MKAEEIESLNSMTEEEAVRIAYYEGKSAELVYDGLFMYKLIPDKFKHNDNVYESFLNGGKAYHGERKAKVLPLYIDHVKAGKKDKAFYGDLGSPMFSHEDDRPPFEDYIQEWRTNPSPELVDAIYEGEKIIKDNKNRIGKRMVNRSAAIAVSAGSSMADSIDADSIEDGMDGVIAELKTGNMDYLLRSLIGNITNVNMDIALLQLPKNAGLKTRKEVNTMKARLLQEQRKSIMAINEIVNPKRSTFIKTATQNNIISTDTPEQIEVPIEDAIEIVPELKTVKTFKKGNSDVKSK